MIALRKLSATPGDLALNEVAPGELGVGQVRVEVFACGVCGTDLHIAEGGYWSRPPVTMGHELSGTVIEVAPDVDPGWLGAEVATQTFFSVCGSCRQCLAGRPNLCAERQSIGSGVDGGFATSVVLPVGNLHRLPDGVSLTIGALSEPLACVCNSLLDPTRIAPGDRVLVTGPGTIGILAAIVARALGGVPTIAGTDRDAVRLAIAEQLGFATTTGAVADLEPFDVAVECSGAGDAMASSLEALRPAGSYVQMGQTDKRVSVPLALVSFKELSISGGFASTPASWRRAIALMPTIKDQLAVLVTEIAPLDDWERVFAATASAAGLKFLLSPVAGS
jgi:L-iditol 2-dehydrogenase